MAGAPRRALALLDDAGVAGCLEELMLASYISIEVMVELVRTGLTTATPQRVKAGRERMEIATLRHPTRGGSSAHKRVSTP